MRRCMCLLLVAIFPFTTGCIGGRKFGCLQESGQIRRTLTEQVDSWNRGDIDGFMSPYWNSPDLTFASGGTVTRGFASTLERYKTKYPTTREMGKLTFSELKCRYFNEDAAVVIGHWKLEREQPVEGLFTLAMVRLDSGKWIIIHDHTSTAEK